MMEYNRNPAELGQNNRDFEQILGSIPDYILCQQWILFHLTFYGVFVLTSLKQWNSSGETHHYRTWYGTKYTQSLAEKSKGQVNYIKILTGSKRTIPCKICILYTYISFYDMTFQVSNDRSINSCYSHVYNGSQELSEHTPQQGWL